MDHSAISYDATGVYREQILYTKPGLIVLQRHWLAPGLASPTNWVIFDASSRRSFAVNLTHPYEDFDAGSANAAHESSVLSDTIRVLAMASEEGVRPGDLLDTGAVAHEATINSMISAGLLQPDAGFAEGPSPFTDIYHRAVFNYPFHDYFDPHWREKDNAAMAEYMAAWPSPPPLTARPGEFFPLPAPSDTELLRDDIAGVLDLSFLSSVLHKTFGVIEERQRPVVGTVLHKSSPSGGSRHPTEIVILLPNGLEGVPSGAYHYDVGQHRLVAAPSYAGAAGCISGTCGFIITSHIERAMWRYRDIRSFRAIPIDAGHIAETLALLLGLRNLECAVSAVGSLSARDFLWYEEPELAFVSVGSNVVSRAAMAQPHVEPDTRPCLNPSLYLTFESGQVRANVLWPDRKSSFLSATDLEFLGGCVHGDQSRENGAREHDGGGGVFTWERVKELSEIGAILPAHMVHSLAPRIQLWSRYGWYITLLEHLEVLASQSESDDCPRGISRVERLEEISGARLLRSLHDRQTCRAFSTAPVPMAVLSNILRGTLSYAFDDCASLGAHLRVFVCPLAVSDMTPCVHEWHVPDARLHPVHVELDRHQVRRMTIGQEAISQSALILWMFAELPKNDPAAYELTLLTLGRIGQRVCLLATDAQLGAFMTPAVSDALIFQTLGIPNAERHVTYAFGLGYRRK